MMPRSAGWRERLHGAACRCCCRRKILAPSLTASNIVHRPDPEDAFAWREKWLRRGRRFVRLGLFGDTSGKTGAAIARAARMDNTGKTQRAAHWARFLRMNDW